MDKIIRFCAMSLSGFIMKKKIVAILPFLTMPIFILIYIILDNVMRIV